MSLHDTDPQSPSSEPAVVFAGTDPYPMSDVQSATVERSGYSDVRTTSATETLRMLRTNESVAAVVCERGLERGDPIALLEAVRVQAPELPFVLVTDRHDETMAGRAFQAGVTEYLHRADEGIRWDTVFERLAKAIAYYRDVRATPAEGSLRTAALEGSPDGVGVTTDGSFVAGNRTLRDIVGYDDRRFDALALGDIFDPETLAIVRGKPDTFRTNVPLTRLDGITFPVDLTTVRIEWNGDEATLVICRDRSVPVAQQRQQFRRAIEAAGHAVYVTDRDETIRYVNAAFEEITGYAAREVLGETPRLFSSGLMSEKRYEELWGTVLAGEPWQGVITNQRKNGDVYYADQTIAPVTMDGDIQGFIAIQSDVTDKKEMQSDLKTFKSIVERIDDPIMVQDLDGDFRLVNEAVADRAGLPKGELIGTDEFAFMDEKTAERIQEMKARTLERSEPVTYQVSPELPTNGGRTFSTVRYPQYDSEGNPTGTLAICRDVTEIKRHERQFRVIERVLRHNLRNDMQVIKGVTEMIGRECDPDTEQYVRRVLETSDTLLETLDKERQITAFLSEPTTVQSVDIADVVRAVADRARRDHPDVTITVDSPGECQVSAVSAIDRAVEELLENAIVHAEKSDPTIELTVRRTDDWVSLKIADDGPGIPEMERDVLTGSEEIGPLHHGRGIGMWMVHLIVKESDGRLEFTENEPHGSVVDVRLPR